MQASSPLKPFGESGLAGAKALAMAEISKAEQMGIADHRLHFFDIFLYAAQPETVEPQLVHRFQHMRMHIITLKPDMIVMMDIIGLAGQHLHQEIIAAMQRIDIQVDQRINAGHFDECLLIRIGIVLRQGKIMRSAEDDDRLADAR